MKKYLYILLIATLLHTNFSFAHFGPRGLTGGTVSTGIRVPGFMFLGTENAGVYRSTNNAISAWGTRSVGLMSGKINDFDFDGTSVIAATDNGLYIFNGVDGTDRFWNKIDQGLVNFFNMSAPSQPKIKINAVKVVNNASDKVIYVGTEQGVYFTKDYGQTFEEVESEKLKGKNILGILLFESSSTVFIASVEGEGLVLNKKISLEHTNDDFVEFNDNETKESSVKLLNVSNQIITISKGSNLMAWMYDNLEPTPSFSSISLNLPNNIEINAIAYTSTKSFLATSNGLFERLNNELSWSLVSNMNFQGKSITTVVPTNDTLIVGVKNMGVFKSNDNGSTWVETNTGFSNIKTYSVDAFGFNDAVSNLVVSATERGVVLSRNLGLSPVLINKGLTDSLNVTDVKIFSNFIYASTQNDGVFRLINNTESNTWEKASQGLPSGKSILKLFKLKMEVLALDEDNKLWVNDASENQWEEFELPFNSEKTVSVLAYDEYLFIASENGVYYTSVVEPEWKTLNNGLPEVPLTSLTEYFEFFT